MKPQPRLTEGSMQGKEEKQVHKLNCHCSNAALFTKTESATAFSVFLKEREEMKTKIRERLASMGNEL